MIQTINKTPQKRQKHTDCCESKWLLGLQSVSEVGSGWYLALDLLER